MSATICLYCFTNNLIDFVENNSIIEKSRFSYIFLKTYPQVIKLFFKKVNTNIRTYAQTVDKLCITCDKTRYCGWFFTIGCGEEKILMWIMWKTLLIS